MIYFQTSKDNTMDYWSSRLYNDTEISYWHPLRDWASRSSVGVPAYLHLDRWEVRWSFSVLDAYLDLCYLTKIITQFTPIFNLYLTFASNAYYTPHTHTGLTTHLIRRGSLTINYPEDAPQLGQVKRETFGVGERIDVPAGKVHEVWIGDEGCEYVIGE